ncbi:YegS/Rv2252/BmrU family lipid kinase [Actinomadura sp. ATCC 31491]|uniref:YegS/Rv2252/BmrU family lipid kinase n=1 Tax=Actinomadura luzonensis TaxID=2805427 RepID=A0ABT0FWZ2_9ACTN|nr:YegS/Rv2252/BmrU family lipid kinase [Actinomadura luzonensis]MCK2216403.1 YegS/Rv2252/BmrU family lipid kinase [Actinomadura luzonensis]
MSPQLALLVNPAARGGRTLRQLEPVARRLRAGGAELSVIVGDDAADALERACTAVAERPDALVAFGGDGLVHLAVQAVAGTDVPLGIIPAGTGNDIAAALGVPCKDPLAAARVVLRMKSRLVDAARVRAGRAEELFAGVVACGFDSRVNERANRLTWPAGSGRYVRAVVGELRTFRPVPFRLVLDGEEVIEREAMLVAVANTRSYGAGMRVCPDARPDDGLLDVLMVEAISKGEFLRVFPSVYRGTHVGHRAVTMRRARTVRLETLGGDPVRDLLDGMVAYADGERVGPVPVECEVQPGALRVLV